MLEHNDDEREELPGPELKKLLDLYLQADEYSREMLKPLFILAGIPLPVVLSRPPDVVTPALGIAALETLIRQSQVLARENLRVMLGIRKIDEQLGHTMLIDAHIAQGRFQEILQAIIEDLKQRRE